MFIYSSPDSLIELKSFQSSAHNKKNKRKTSNAWPVFSPIDGQVFQQNRINWAIIVDGHPRKTFTKLFSNRANAFVTWRFFKFSLHIHIRKWIPSSGGYVYQQIGIIWTTLLEGYLIYIILCEIIFLIWTLLLYKKIF